MGHWLMKAVVPIFMFAGLTACSGGQESTPLPMTAAINTLVGNTYPMAHAFGLSSLLLWADQAPGTNPFNITLK